MSQDRYLKVVVTVTAVALPVIAMAQLDSAATASATGVQGDAEVDQPVPQEQLLEEPPTDAGGTRAPEITLPLRWRVATAVEDTGSNAYCTTVINVTNATDAIVSVEVEWHDDISGSLLVVSSSVSAFDQHTFVADDQVFYSPWVANVVAGLADFDGYALVAADDPRIFVHAAVICRDGLGGGTNVVALYDSPVFPVGTTADYFQAGAPGAAPIPPTAAVAEPES